MIEQEERGVYYCVPPRRAPCCSMSQLCGKCKNDCDKCGPAATTMSSDLFHIRYVHGNIIFYIIISCTNIHVLHLLFPISFNKWGPFTFFSKPRINQNGQLRIGRRTVVAKDNSFLARMCKSMRVSIRQKILICKC